MNFDTIRVSGTSVSGLRERFEQSETSARKNPLPIRNVGNVPTSARAGESQSRGAHQSAKALAREQLRPLLGSVIAKGSEGTVCHHKLDPQKVIKIFNRSISRDDRLNEVKSMNAYHGRDFASFGGGGRALIMKFIEGTPLHKIRDNSLPPTAMREMGRVLTELQSKQIWPEDLCEANFLYDTKSGKLSPVDLKSRDLASMQDREKKYYATAYKGGVQNLQSVLSRKIKA
jgi:hypothetical protein